MAALMASGTVVPLRLIYIPPHHRLYSYLYGINLLIMVSLVPRVRYRRQVHASSLFHVIGQYWEMQLRCLLWNCIGAFGCREWHSIALTNRRWGHSMLLNAVLVFIQEHFMALTGGHEQQCSFISIAEMQCTIRHYKYKRHPGTPIYEPAIEVLVIVLMASTFALIQNKPSYDSIPNLNSVLFRASRLVGSIHWSIFDTLIGVSSID